MHCCTGGRAFFLGGIATGVIVKSLLGRTEREISQGTRAMSRSKRPLTVSPEEFDCDVSLPLACSVRSQYERSWCRY